MSVFISGIPILYSATLKLVFQNKITSSLLISIAMLASIGIGELFAAGEVAFIMALGSILEDLTVKKARKNLKKLIDLTPTEGRKIVNINGSIQERIIPAKDILKDDILRVLPGEIIPVDGVIIKGSSTVDQSVITGESLPVDKGEGDEVYGGNLNIYGSIDIKVLKVSKDSTIQKLIDLVQEAERKKAPVQTIADKWAAILVPVAVLISILTFIVTYFIGMPTAVCLTRAVTILVVFCPCALALATPTAIVAAIGQASKYGVIIKSGEALEKMGKVDTITFDKTGTLTYARLEVSDVVSTGISTEELLSICASNEARSEHPLAKAILSYARKKEVKILETSNFKMFPGLGIYSEIKDDKILCGNEKFLDQNDVTIDNEIKNKLDIFRNEGKATILVAFNKRCIGIISLSDCIKETAKDVISSFLNMGVDTILLTGDHRTTAEYFSKTVGIKTFYSDLLPEKKVEYIVRFQKEGKSVCMVGDGVNDAPALKTADLGVSMGSLGSDITVDASDIALMHDDITKLPYLKKLSNLTVKTIKLNITVSMCINFIAVTLSILGLLTPVTGALVHNAGSVMVVLNAALLYDKKIS